MGDADGAATGLRKLALDPKLQRQYIGGWNEDQIVTGAGSKNIPMLRFAHDLLLADRRNDVVQLERARVALRGYLGACKRFGHFLGEEYSTIYWRWIVIPLWVGYVVAQERGWLTEEIKAQRWLLDFVIYCALTASYDNGFRASEISKKPGSFLPGMACAGIMGARSWVYNTGDDNKRRFGDDTMSWIDASSHAPWLEWALGRRGINALTGGNGFVMEVTKGVHEIYYPKHFVSEGMQDRLRWMIASGELDREVLTTMEYGPPEPIIVGRTDQQTWAVGEDSYTEGSTSFMHVKIFDANKWYKVYSIAHPLKRSNKDPGVANVATDFRSVTLKADDGTVFDWDLMREKEGELRILLPMGPIKWVVRVKKGELPQIMYPEATPTPEPVAIPWIQRLLKWIMRLFS